MVQWSVEIEIDAGLQNISAAGQCVTIVRNAGSFVRTLKAAQDQAMAVPAPTVAWLAFQPMQRNVITWTDDLGVYASMALPAAADVIGIAAQALQVVPGQTATLQNGAFALGSPSGDSGYRATNLESALVYLGLLATATLNGIARPAAAPISIQPVLRNQSCDFFPDPLTITIFLSNAGSDGTLLPSDSFGGLTMTFDSSSPGAKVGFNAATNAFFLQ